MARIRTCSVYIMARAIEGKLCAPVKVGMAEDPHKRRGEIQTGNPHEIQVAAVFEFPSKAVAREIERSFHDVLSEKRVRGEWFDMEVPDAMVSMCINIRVALAHHTSFRGDELERALGMSGVLKTETLLKKHGWQPPAPELFN